jgi:hypothetical protein
MNELLTAIKAIAAIVLCFAATAGCARLGLWIITWRMRQEK